MPAPFPHRHSATVSRTFGSRARLEALSRPGVQGSPTTELDGAPSSGSPEHLLLSSIGLSLLMSFEAFAARDGLQLLAWRAAVHGTVEPSPEGLTFTSIVLCLDLELAGELTGVEQTLEEARQASLVLNALRVPVVIETTIQTPEHAPEQHRQAG